MDTYERSTQSAYNSTTQTLGYMVQIAVAFAAVAAVRAAQAREDRYRQQQAAELERARLDNERLRAERAAAEPLMRQVWQERFWEELGQDPREAAQRIGRAWQAAAEWATSDPYAKATLDHLRKQLDGRLGLKTQSWDVDGPQVARLVLVSDPDFRGLMDKAREAAIQAAEEAPHTSYVVLIQDLENPYEAAYRGEVLAGPGLDAETVAAQEFRAWSENVGAGQVEEKGAGRFSVQVMENTGDDAAKQVPAATVRGDQAESVLAADTERQRRILSGEESSVSNGERLRALGGEARRLEVEEQQRLERRAATVQQLDGDLPSDQRARLEAVLEAIDGGLPALREERTNVALQTQATTAKMRGEDPQLVYQAQRLSDSLDPGWWQTASAQEIAGVWDHVHQWSPGKAREETDTLLRESLERHHGLTLPTDADAELVRELLGGRDEDGPARRWDQRSQDLYDQGHALYEQAFDGYHRALLLDQQAAAEGTAESEAGALRQDAEATRQQAEADTAHAEEFVRQGLWLSERLEQIEEGRAAGDASQVEAVREAFEAMWGTAPEPELETQLQELAAAEPALSIPATRGSTDPAAVPAPATGSESAATAEPGDDVDPSGNRERKAEDARRQAAHEALEEVGDVEAAIAARIAEKGYPRGPQAAVETPPKTRTPRPLPGSGREKAAELER